MILTFRTRNTINGNCGFLQIDTEKRTYTTFPRQWISKDVPLVRAADIRLMIRIATADNYKEV